MAHGLFLVAVILSLALFPFPFFSVSFPCGINLPIFSCRFGGLDFAFVVHFLAIVPSFLAAIRMFWRRRRAHGLAIYLRLSSFWPCCDHLNGHPVRPAVHLWLSNPTRKPMFVPHTGHTLSFPVLLSPFCPSREIFWFLYLCPGRRADLDADGKKLVFLLSDGCGGTCRVVMGPLVVDVGRQEDLL